MKPLGSERGRSTRSGSKLSMTKAGRSSPVHPKTSNAPSTRPAENSIASSKSATPGAYRHPSCGHMDKCAAEAARKEVQLAVKLRERWGRAPRDRLSGAGPKPLQAAAVKSRGGE